MFRSLGTGPGMNLGLVLNLSFVLNLFEQDGRLTQN